MTPVFWVGHLAKQYIVIFANDRTNLLLNFSQIFALLVGSGLFLLSAIFSFLSLYSFQDKGARRRFAFSLIIALPLMSIVGVLLPTDSNYGILLGVGVASVAGWMFFGDFLVLDYPSEYGLDFDLVSHGLLLYFYKNSFLLSQII
ncbi:hypothetical protein GM50_1550 [freshwater metagenome]|uniref:Uncharacterized protein n=1 Tax=freshwater metagenome TaxID=449393 RepID=A0A094SP35_9ZZZZ